VLAQDAAAGKTSFNKCMACHAVGEGAKNKVGPELNGLDGRKSGSVAGYAGPQQELRHYLEQGHIP
jgi:cytochrome c